MCEYYNLDENPGISLNNSIKKNFDFLDDSDLKTTLIDFTDGKQTSITFNIPQMHCSSCIWILENLHKLDEGIIHSQVNFLKKTLRLNFIEEKTSLKKIVLTLESIGYGPELNLADKQTDKILSENKQLYYRLGVAGFAFGNIMLLSFPEYLGVAESKGTQVNWIFNYLNLLLALPVVFFSGSIYFSSALKGLKNKIVNIDVPISLGIVAIFLRSFYEIVFGVGAGYFDSLSALVFLLLAGRLFQNKTYDALNFERNYKSYFPIAVHTIKDGIETTIPVNKVKLKDRLIIKNNEIIPADSVLIRGNAHIDYSFVTGESTPIEKVQGEVVYAGGRQIGGIIEVDVVKEISQSYLTQLWNNKIFDKKYNSNLDTITNTVSKYFTIIILLIATIAAIFWMIYDPSKAVFAFTSVLIIACPCALALSTPFTLGNSLRIFGKNKLYIKNTTVIEKLSKITAIVFDKTGTVTITGKAKIEYDGEVLSDNEKSMIKSLTRNSSHPLSRKINDLFIDSPIIQVEKFLEEAGKGISGEFDGVKVKIGSALFVGKVNENGNELNSRVFVEFNGSVKGYFLIKNVYRNEFKNIISNLKKNFKLALLSGDSAGEKNILETLFPSNSELKFRQDPYDKLNYVKSLQDKNEIVLMFGDGLNDSGALKQSDVGISITEDINNFSPSSDAILDAKNFEILPNIIKFSKLSKNIIILSFTISFLYNIVGLYFAVSGLLSPIIAAILMPLSSISVVAFSTIATNLSARKVGL